MARKKTPGPVTFYLFGVQQCRFIPAAEGDATLEIVATEDIEADLLHAGLRLYGMNDYQVQCVRTLLKPGPWRERLEALMAKAREATTRPKE